MIYTQRRKTLPGSKVSNWPVELAKLNGSFTRIARQSLSSGSLASWTIAEETLRPETQPLFATRQQGLVDV